MRVKYLVQEHNADSPVPRPGLELGPFDPESSALTIGPPRLPLPLTGSQCKSFKISVMWSLSWVIQLNLEKGSSYPGYS